MTEKVVSADGDAGGAAHNHPPKIHINAALWRALALCFTVLILIHSGLHVWQFSGHSDMFGATGVPKFQTALPDGGFTVSSIAPGSAADRAGLHAGDRIVYDHRSDNLRVPLRGEPVGLTVKGSTGSRHLFLTAEPFPQKINWPYLSADAVYLVGLLLGGLIILRAGDRMSSILLGTALVSYAVTGQWPRLWEGAAPVFPIFYVLLSYIYYGSPALMLLATRALRREASGRDPMGLKLLTYGVLSVHFVLIAVLCWNDLSQTPLPGLPTHTFLTYTAPVFAEYALATLTLVLAGREVAQGGRSRYALMLGALLLIILSGVLDGVILSTGNDYTTVRPLLVSWYVAIAAGFLLFAYAVLRHRVIDVGFAVNRSLIYGVMSFVVLLLFGLAEWGIEKIIPAEWREHLEANAFISAGIALGIFLVFHRIRDAVEEVIEGVFFHKWHANEAQLERFVRKAEHIVRPEALKAAGIAEFARFSGGAQVALYRRDEARYVLDTGSVAGFAPVLDIDLPALVEMRAEGKPLFAEDAAPLHAALALPMLQRNELTGFVILGLKPSGDAYRPDERQALAEATQKIGADLHALRIEELQQANAELSARLRQSDHQLQQIVAGAPSH